MNALDHNQKVAVLLNALGSEAIEPALSQLSPARANQVRTLIKQYESDPLNSDVVDTVLEEFETFFKFAIKTVDAETYWSDMISLHDPDDDENEDDANDYVQVNESAEQKSGANSQNEPRIFKIFKPSGDAVADLNKLAPEQIAGTLKYERPKTVSLVLGCLEQKKVAETIELLPEEIQTDLVTIMLTEQVTSPDLLQQIVRTTVDKALKIEKLEDEKPDPDKRFAEILRQLDRPTRARMLNHLKENDAETAEALQKHLYVFADVIKYDDRSVQKIMAEVDKSQLVVALQGAEPDVQDKIFNNLSKRARQSLQEEMEFQTQQNDAEVQMARETVAAIIAKLDQADQLMEI